MKMIRSRLGSVLFWSVISAAFIGPGTVTTAAAAGALSGVALLWALTFSTLGCIVLQEAAARLTIASGLSLGQALARRYPAAWPRALVAGAVVLGCAAYQAGNLLGAVAGLALVVDAPGWALTALVALVACGVLWWGGIRGVANFLGLVVAFMGIMFMVVATWADFSAAEVSRAALLPALPDGSLLLVVGLVGTTIVPYNLFLGSGIGQGQPIGQMRFGIAVAVGLGGAISAAILLAGTLVVGEFSYQALAQAIHARMGAWGAALFGWGLFAAGFTSAITAPLASAITIGSSFGPAAGRWQPQGWAYRATWGLVMLFGAGFGLAGARPVPVILLAQAANGLLLPGVAGLLFWLVNDRSLMPPQHRNGRLANALMLAVVWVTATLGTNQLLKTASSVLGATVSGTALLQMACWVATLLCLLAAWPVYRRAS
jgi:manganese transport protein